MGYGWSIRQDSNIEPVVYKRNDQLGTSFPEARQDSYHQNCICKEQTESVK